MIERIDQFLAHLSGERGLSNHTTSAYRNDLLQFQEYLAGAAAVSTNGPLPLSGVDRSTLAGYFLSMKERGYAAATVARKVAALRSFFHYLRRDGTIAVDPTEGIGSPEVKKVVPRSISADEVLRLFERAERRDTPDGHRDAAMLRTLYSTGIRVGELVTLDVADFAPSEGRITVTGRGGRSRVLPLDEATVASVQTYVSHARHYLARHDPTEKALFLNHRGQRLTRQGFWLIMKALVKECGIHAQVTPHTLRHTFATHRLQGGLALEQLRQLLGHASIATTQIYTQRSAGVEDVGRGPDAAHGTLAAEATLGPAPRSRPPKAPSRKSGPVAPLTPLPRPARRERIAVAAGRR